MNKDRFKFRVFDKETGKYYKTRISKGSGCIVYQHPSDSHCAWVQIGTMFAELEQDEKTYANTGLEPDFIIEQCTGLKDKNGNLIYESDYVKANDVIYRVFWNKTKISLANILNGDIIDISETITMEIVGNEHEKDNISEIPKNTERRFN